jgi:DNA-directed RNA polymerase subunit RPC12/RpoP
MARLVAARCPTCGAGLKIDLDQEIVSCSYCNTSAFVKTRTRPVTQQALHQHVPVIDTTSRGLLPFVWIAVSAGVVVAAVAVLLAARSLRPAPLPPNADADEMPARRPTGEAMPYIPKPAEAARPAAPPEQEQEQSSERPSPSSSHNVRMGPLTVSGRLSTDVVQRIIRQNFGRFRMCYDQARVRAPQLEARVTLRFVIGRDGSVSNVSDGGSDANDASLVACVKAAYSGLSFPQPEGGIVTVVSPLFFRP